MERCKTCKHWKPYRVIHPNMACADAGEALGGYCYNEKLTEDYFKTKYDADMLVYSFSENRSPLWTGPEFGCVNHSVEAALRVCTDGG